MALILAVTATDFYFVPAWDMILANTDLDQDWYAGQSIGLPDRPILRQPIVKKLKLLNHQ